MRGSIRKYQGKRAVSWTATVDVGSDPMTGRQRQRRRSFPTRQAAEAWLTRMLHELRSGTYVEPSTLTLAEFLEEWLATYAAGRKPCTYDRCAQLIRGHIVPTLGQVRLGRLAPLDLVRLYQHELAPGRIDGRPGGLSPRTVCFLHATLRLALGHAVRWGLLAPNVADAVDPPRLERHELRTWDAGQIATFLAAAVGTRYAPVYTLAVLTRLRRGELLGLCWRDVDLERGELAVRRALVDRHGQLAFNSPKTHRSSRPVAPPEAAISMLRRHRAAQNAERLRAAEAWEGLDLVFATPGGGPIQPSNLARVFRRLTERARLPAIRLHDLRHAHATLLLVAGVHPKVVSERLEHATVGVTLDTYSHVLPDLQREAAAQLDQLLGSRIAGPDARP